MTTYVAPDGANSPRTRKAIELRDALAAALTDAKDHPTRFEPRAYYVTVTIPKNRLSLEKRPSGGTETKRVGFARDLAEARTMIQLDKAEVAHINGGLRNALAKQKLAQRTYRVWRAEWTEVEL